MIIPCSFIKPYHLSINVYQSLYHSSYIIIQHFILDFLGFGYIYMECFIHGLMQSIKLGSWLMPIWPAGLNICYLPKIAIFAIGRFSCFYISIWNRIQNLNCILFLNYPVWHVHVQNIMTFQYLPRVWLPRKVWASPIFSMALYTSHKWNPPFKFHMQSMFL